MFSPWKGNLLTRELSSSTGSRNVHEVQGDLFRSPRSSSLAHCVSSDMKMGAGIAVLFRNKFGQVEELKHQKKSVGEVAYLKDGPRYIFYLVTKKMFFDKPTETTLRSSLLEMKNMCQKFGVKKLAMPRIGCGLDGLRWPSVFHMVNEIFSDCDIIITIYSIPDRKPKTLTPDMRRSQEEFHSYLNLKRPHSMPANEMTSKWKMQSHSYDDESDTPRRRQRTSCIDQNSDSSDIDKTVSTSKNTRDISNECHNYGTVIRNSPTPVLSDDPHAPLPRRRKSLPSSQEFRTPSSNTSKRIDVIPRRAVNLAEGRKECLSPSTNGTNGCHKVQLLCRNERRNGKTFKPSPLTRKSKNEIPFLSDNLEDDPVHRAHKALSESSSKSNKRKLTMSSDEDDEIFCNINLDDIYSKAFSDKPLIHQKSRLLANSDVKKRKLNDHNAKMAQETATTTYTARSSAESGREVKSIRKSDWKIINNFSSSEEEGGSQEETHHFSECQQPSHHYTSNSEEESPVMRETLNKSQNERKEKRSRKSSERKSKKSKEKKCRDSSRSQERKCRDSSRSQERKCRDSSRSQERKCRDSSRSQERKCRDSSKSQERKCRDSSRGRGKKCRDSSANQERKCDSSRSKKRKHRDSSQREKRRSKDSKKSKDKKSKKSRRSKEGRSRDSSECSMEKSQQSIESKERESLDSDSNRERILTDSEGSEEMESCKEWRKSHDTSLGRNVNFKQSPRKVEEIDDSSPEKSSDFIKRKELPQRLKRRLGEKSSPLKENTVAVKESKCQKYPSLETGTEKISKLSPTGTMYSDREKGSVSVKARLSLGLKLKKS